VCQLSERCICGPDTQVASDYRSISVHFPSQKAPIMLRRSFTAGLVLAATGILGAGTLLAAPKTYKYRCPKCKLIQEYGMMGSKKCPNDGKTMIRMN
jgi:hypothetical protein